MEKAYYKNNAEKAEIYDNFFFSSSLKELNIIMVKIQQEQYIKQLFLNIDFLNMYVHDLSSRVLKELAERFSKFLMSLFI